MICFHCGIPKEGKRCGGCGSSKFVPDSLKSIVEGNIHPPVGASGPAYCTAVGYQALSSYTNSTGPR